MHQSYPHIASIKQQNGAALIIGLVLLLALTIVGVGSLNKTSLEQRMAGNMGDINLAFNAAETASRGYTKSVNITPNYPPSQANCQDVEGPCIKTGLDNDWWSDPDNSGHSWWKTNAQPYSGEVSSVNTAPHVVLESQGFVADNISLGHRYDSGSGIDIYRLTTRGTGASDHSEAITQQSLAKRYN